MSRICDVCQESNSVLFCKADAAFLCMSCDVKVHAANKLVSRHERAWLCDVCEHAPADVICKADAAALCVACDTDIHSANSLASRHERVPVTTFFECPSVMKVSHIDTLVPSFGQETIKHSCNQYNEDDDDSESYAAVAASWLLPNPKTFVDEPVKNVILSEAFAVSRSDLLPSTEKRTGSKLQKHKMNSMNFSNESFLTDMEPYLDMKLASSAGVMQPVTDSIVPVHGLDLGQATYNLSSGSGSSEADASCKGQLSFTTSLTNSVSSSSLDVGVVPDTNLSDISNSDNGSRSLERPPQVHQSGQLEPMGREARVQRYKEKRKNRKFEKTIRYASRKAYAETRPRIKGRFAKRSEVEMEKMYLCVPDTGFGLVPSF
eukprot:c27786_g1_i1 orf=730-1857(+)